MKESFTIDELRNFFESNVVNSNRHGNSYYTTLDGEHHSTGVGYFIECMDYFLQDLQAYLDEINKPELERNKKIASYKTPIEALNHLHEHINKDCILSFMVCKFLDNGESPVYESWGSSLRNLNSNTGTDFDRHHPNLNWMYSESYSFHYDEEYNNLILFVNIGEYSKLSKTNKLDEED